MVILIEKLAWFPKLTSDFFSLGMAAAVVFGCTRHGVRSLLSLLSIQHLPWSERISLEGEINLEVRSLNFHRTGVLPCSQHFHHTEHVAVLPARYM
jgi:hypothetical protein